MTYDSGRGYNPTLDVSPAVPQDSFMGPGQDTTPFGYQPQYGITDPTMQGELGQEYGFGQALNARQIGAAPQFALNQNSRDSLANQIAFLNANLGVDQSSAQNNTDYQLAQLGLQGDKLGVQRGALARQGPLADLLHSIAGGRNDLSRLQAWQQADQSNRGLTSQDIARGSNTSIGYNQGLGDIRNQLANQLQGLDYSKLQEGAQYGEQKASLEDQGKMLDIAGQGLGLDRQHLNDQLQMGLQRMGIQNADAVSQLLDKMNSSSIQDQILAQQIFNQAIQNSDYYAQFYPVHTTAPSTSAPPAAGISAGTGAGGTSDTNPGVYGGSPGGGINFG